MWKGVPKCYNASEKGKGYVPKCNTNTFHWPRRVTGHIIRLPPFTSIFFCFNLSKPENFVALFNWFGCWSELSLEPPPVQSWFPDWLFDNPPLSEWVSRRDMVMMVFPSPIASARIFKIIIWSRHCTQQNRYIFKFQ